MAVAYVLDGPTPKVQASVLNPPASEGNLQEAMQQMLIDLLKALSAVLNLFAKDMENSSQVAASFQQLAQTALTASENEQSKIDQELDEKEREEKSSGILGDILGGLGILVGFACGGLVGALVMASLFVLTTPGLVPGTGGQSLLDLAASKIGGPSWLQGLLRVFVIVVAVALVSATGNEAGAAEEASVGGAEIGAEEAAVSGADVSSDVVSNAANDVEDLAESSPKSVLKELYDKLPKVNFVTTMTAAQMTESLNPFYYLSKAVGANDDEAQKASLVINILISILSLAATDFSASNATTFTEILGNSSKAQKAMKVIGTLTSLTQISKSGLDIKTGVITLAIADLNYAMSKYKGVLSALETFEKCENNRIDGLQATYQQAVQEANSMANDFQSWTAPEYAAANAIAANAV
jgi:hypothetical protein